MKKKQQKARVEKHRNSSRTKAQTHFRKTRKQRSPTVIGDLGGAPGRRFATVASIRSSGPGGPRRSVESYEILSFVDFNKKKVSKSTAAVYPFCALKRGILRGNRHMWAPPLYHFV